MTSTMPKRSILEIHFEWYLDELKEAGYITEWIPQPESFVLFEKATYVYEKHLKTKIKEIEAAIPMLSQHVYTPDFGIIWAERANEVFHTLFYSGKKALVECPFASSSRGTSLIEIKPPRDRNNMIRVFGLNQRWMWQKYGMYVQKVVPDKLFEQTFVPVKYLFCDKKTSQKRKINYPVKLLKDYKYDYGTAGGL